eukprot:10115143-Karenia_brevis.AAC.1
MNQHFSVKCAGKYFQIQNMRRNRGAIVFSNTLAAMVVVIQNVPTQTVRRVQAATTVNVR